MHATPIRALRGIDRLDFRSRRLSRRVARWGTSWSMDRVAIE
jgi:hypothetical protein